MASSTPSATNYDHVYPNRRPLINHIDRQREAGNDRTRRFNNAHANDPRLQVQTHRLPRSDSNNTAVSRTSSGNSTLAGSTNSSNGGASTNTSNRSNSGGTSSPITASHISSSSATSTYTPASMGLLFNEDFTEILKATERMNEVMDEFYTKKRAWLVEQTRKEEDVTRGLTEDLNVWSWRVQHAKAVFQYMHQRKLCRDALLSRPIQAHPSVTVLAVLQPISDDPAGSSTRHDQAA